jgi:hypothetical protein
LAVPALAPEWYDNQPGPSTATLVAVSASSATVITIGNAMIGGIDATLRR